MLRRVGPKDQPAFYFAHLRTANPLKIVYNSIMKNLKYFFITSFLLATSFIVSNQALASTPTLSVTQNGTIDSEIITVHGDTNSPIILNYYSTTASGLQTYNLGSTNSAGSFWTAVTTASLNLSTNSSVYVTVNGQQSNSVAWPYTVSNTSSTGTLILSQTSITMTPGQNAAISASNATSLYLSNNSNPSVANVSISGNQATVTANSSGSTVITLCAIGSNTNCASAYITIQAAGAQSLTFSQSNVTVASGQTATVTISGGTGTYSVLNNSNSSVITTTLSSNTLNLYGNSGSGSASITVCSSDNSSCGIITVTIGSTTSTGITFSQTNPVISMAQSMTNYIYGGSGSYYVSSNSNSNVVQANISNSSVVLYGNNTGTASITVCSVNANNCGSFTVTVNSGGGLGNISLSQTTLTLLVGQTISVTVSGGTMPYNLPTYSTNIAQASLNSNVLSVTGIAVGTSVINVCSASGGCIPLSVTINGSGTGQAPTLSQSSVSINAGQSAIITISGTGGYYVSGNTNSAIATVTVSGNSATILGNNAGQSTITFCQTAGQCVTLYVTVGSSGTTATGGIVLNPIVNVGQTVSYNLSSSIGYSSYYIPTNTGTIFSAIISGSTLTITGVSTGASTINVCASGGTCVSISVTVLPSTTASNTNTNSSPTITQTSNNYKFIHPLSLGSKGTDVSELQKRLTVEGFYTGPINGNYGTLTMKAVQSYQKYHGLKTLGSVGPGTRTALNN